MRKSNKSKIFMSLFIVVIMVASVLGIMIGNNDSSAGSSNNVYNGYEFFNSEDGRLLLKVDEKYVPFDYFPSDLEEIEMEEVTIDFNKVYLAYNPEKYDYNTEYSLIKIRSIFEQFRGIDTVVSCSQEEGCGDIPIVDCNSDKAVIEFLIGDNDKIYNEGNCIVLEANESSTFSKEADLINYNLFGVM